MEKILAWHFLPDDGYTQFSHGKKRYKPRVGQILRAKGELSLCNNGLHASVRAIDALCYAPGSLACRVEMGAPIIQDSNKLVARTRKILWTADATIALHEFAIAEARAGLLRERSKGYEPDKRSWDALRIKRRWLKGKATDEELAAAGAAARDAARDAAWAAANKRLERRLNKLCRNSH